MLLEANGPVLFHCSGGKDRTGMFSALLLTMLGVEHAQVIQDYLLSNEVPPDQAIEIVAAKVKAPREAVQAVTRVDVEYLDAMFREIDVQFGSIDNYRRNGLGISDTDLVALKTRLLDN